MSDQDRVIQDLRGELEALSQRVTALEQRDSFPIPGAWRLRRFLRRVRGITTPKLWYLHQHEPRPISQPPLRRRTSAASPILKVSIVTPSFNQARFIVRTAASVLNQDYGNLEYIVQDGGSGDETLEVLSSFGDRLTYFSEKDAGQADALNRAFRRSSGDIMAYLNSDDLLTDGTIQYVAGYFATHPNVDIVYGHRIVIDEQDQEVGRWILPPHTNSALRWADWVPQETMFWRRSLWEMVGEFDTSFHFALDWDFLLRCTIVNARFKRLPRFLGCFRVHKTQKTSAQISTVGIQEMEQLRSRYLGRNPSQIEITRKLRKYYFSHLICHYGYRAGIFRYG